MCPRDYEAFQTADSTVIIPEVNDHPQSGWLDFSRLRRGKTKARQCFNGALATGCASMTIPCFAWDGLDSRPLGGNTREQTFSIIVF